MKLDILYEDALVVVVDKPPGVVVHPTYGHSSGTVLDALRGRTGSDPQIVGRLDKDTSGVLIAATDRQAHALLQRTSFEKDYLALVHGRVDEAEGTITLRLRVDPLDRRRMAIDAAGAICETRFRRVASADNVTLVCCRLITGRRHQIRAHLAARGWPIVGDRVYGRGDDGLPRHALHSWQTAFVHPISGSRIRITAPLSPDFQRLVSAYELVVAGRFA